MGSHLYRRARNGAVLATTAVAWYYVTDTRASIHAWTPALMRILKPDHSTQLDPRQAIGAEAAHIWANRCLAWAWTTGLYPRERAGSIDWQGRRYDVQGNSDTSSEPSLRPSKKGEDVVIFGHLLDGPIGISAGLDKVAAIPDALFALGASLVEVGGCTPLPQDGNARPRVFRIPAQQAVINRYGLNSLGADHMAQTLADRYDTMSRHRAPAERDALPRSLIPGKLLAVQIAKNKDTPDNDMGAIERDYVYCVDRLRDYADIIVVNVSSPNTPGLRSLQRIEPLTQILTAVVKAAQTSDKGRSHGRLSVSKHSPAIMVKVSPDEDSPEQISSICAAIEASGIDGIIVGNTTKSRPPFQSALKSSVQVPQQQLDAAERKALKQQGGYSGPLTFPHTLSLIKRYRTELPKDKVIFASGGITTGQQVWQCLEAGASLAQIYTAITYGGVGTITRLKTEMGQHVQL